MSRTTARDAHPSFPRRIAVTFDVRPTRMKVARQRLIYDEENRGVRVIVKEVLWSEGSSPVYVVLGFIDHRIEASVNGLTVQRLALEDAEAMGRRLREKRNRVASRRA